MNNVFLAYSRSDEAFARALTDQLLAKGVRVWFDMTQISPGESWQESIRSAISECDAVILLISRAMGDSGFATLELGYSQAFQKPVIPIILEKPITLPLLIFDAQFIDVSSHKPDALSTARLIVKRLEEIGIGYEDKPIAPPEVEKASKGYIFISYASPDSDFVIELRKCLKKYGYAYWDFQESDRDYQTELFREIERAIEDAAAFISVISPSWRESQWTPNELKYAQDAKIPEFIVLGKRLIRPMPILVNMHNHIDFTVDFDDGCTQLGEALKKKGL